MNKIPLCVSLGILLAICGARADVPNKDTTANEALNTSKADEVQLNGPNVDMDGGAAPLVHLSQEIQGNAAGRRFRITWSFHGGAGGHADSTALYDRSNATLKLFCVTFNPDGKYYTHKVYYGVTDNSIHQLAAKFRDDYSTTEMAYFDQLPNGKDLGSKFVKYRN